MPKLFAIEASNYYQSTSDKWIRENTVVPVWQVRSFLNPDFDINKILMAVDQHFGKEKHSYGSAGRARVLEKRVHWHTKRAHFIARPVVVDHSPNWKRGSLEKTLLILEEINQVDDTQRIYLPDLRPFWFHFTMDDVRNFLEELELE